MREKDPRDTALSFLNNPLSRRALLRRAAVAGVALPTLGSLLAACEVDDDDDEPDEPAVDPDDDDEPVVDDDDEPVDDDDDEEPVVDDDPDEPQVGGSVTWALESDVDNLIPFGATPTSNMWGKEHMYDSLMEFDRDLNVQPALAESYDVSEDATHYTFNLREGVLFHDGRELSAEDVVFSLEHAGNPPEPGTDLGYFEAFQAGTFEVADDYTVELELPDPDPTIVGLLAWARHTPIVPEGIFDEIDVRTEGIGTGPFRLVEFVSDDRVVYERFEDYWKEGVPYLDELTLLIIPDESARVSALRAGEIDGGTFSADVVPTLEGDEELEVMRGLFAAPRVIQFTIHGDEPWSDVRVRQAVNFAINRQDIIDRVYAGEAELSGPIPPGYGEWFIPEDELLENWYTPDLDRARELMAEAGYEDGFEVELQTIADPRDYTELGEVVQSHLAEINIDVSVQPLEIGEFAANNANGDFEWQSTGRGMRGDPSQFVVDFRPPARQEWFTAWENDELTQLYTEALETGVEEERLEKYRRIQEIILEEAPNVYTVQPYMFQAVRSRLNGMYVSYTQFNVGLREAWVED